LRKYRCVHDIIYDLLKTLSNEYRLKITQLCSQANLPLDRCSKIIQHLVNHGLVRRVVSGKHVFYELSDLGYAYIGLYDQLNNIIKTR